MNYFHGVAAELRRRLTERSKEAFEITEVRTIPTGSIRRRAARLLDLVVETGGLEQDGLHFIGHSTGGLDVRMLLTPGVHLDRGNGAEERIGELTRTAITLSTPHFGTPLANLFLSLHGRNLLRLLTVLATSRPGRYGVYLAARLPGFLPSLAESPFRRWVSLTNACRRMIF